jgi:type IV pilus assembly protein PilA
MLSRISHLISRISSPTENRRRNESGYTLTELLIVIVVLLVVMTIAVPALQHNTRHANETDTVASLRDLYYSESAYNAAYPTHGFACSLRALGGKQGVGAPTAEAAQLIPEDLASGKKSGYTFTFSDCRKTMTGNQDQYISYRITAVPDKPGYRGFCTDESGHIRFDPKGGTNCTELLR